MSSALERLGRFAAPGPWIVIGSWGGDRLPGDHLRSSLRPRPRGPVRGTGTGLAPGHRTARAGGLGRGRARCGRRPHPSGPRDELLRLPGRAGRQTAVESEVVSPDGEVALIRIQYPERQHLEPDDLANVQGAHEAPGRAELFDGWYPRIDAPIKGRTVLDTSGHRPLFEQPDDFLDYLTDVVVPSTAQLPRS